MSASANSDSLATIVEDSEPSASLFRLGMAITAAWLVGLLIYCVCEWSHILAMKPDQGATFVSGVVGPLAFLWLVLGFLQHGRELRHSVEALRLQSLELKNSVEQQRELVDVTRAQLDHEREVRLAQEEAERRAAQPVWTLAAIGSWGGRSFDVQFTNAGPAAANVVLEWPIGQPCFAADYIKTGDALKGNISFPLDPERDERVLGRITHRDSRDMRGEWRFAFRVRGASLTFEEEAAAALE